MYKSIQIFTIVKIVSITVSNLFTSVKTCKRKINCTKEYNANSLRTYTNVHEYPAKRDEDSVDLSTRREDPRVSGQMVGQPLIASACRVCKHSEVFTRVRAYAWPAPRISRSSGGLVSLIAFGPRAHYNFWPSRVVGMLLSRGFRFSARDLTTLVPH